MSNLLQQKPKLDPRNNCGVLLLGPPKAGKSTFCCGLDQPIAFLDCDNNLAGPIKRATLADPEFNYFYCDANRDEDGQEVPREKRWARCMSFMTEAAKSSDIRTIVVDSLSPLSDFLVFSIIAASKGEKFNTVKVGGMDNMAMAHWIPFKNYMTQFVAAGRTSGKLFVVCCHEQTMTNDSGGVEGYRPMIPGSLKDNLSGFFSDVWRCHNTVVGKDIKYFLRVAPMARHQIGNSLGMKEQEFNMTNLKPREMWKQLQPYFVV